MDFKIFNYLNECVACLLVKIRDLFFKYLTAILFLKKKKPPRRSEKVLIIEKTIL